MSGIIAPAGVKLDIHSYEMFTGWDTSKDVTTMDSGKGQALTLLQDGHADWRGQLVRDAAAVPLEKILADSEAPDPEYITHVAFYSRDVVVFAGPGKTGSMVFSTSSGHTFQSDFANDSVISSTVFNLELWLFARGQYPVAYNGSSWRRGTSKLVTEGKAYTTVVQRRLIIAGCACHPTQVDISRVDNGDIFYVDEQADEESVLRAGFIDIGNLVGTGEVVTGVSAFEQNRLVIFTQDRALLYRLDPDIDKWLVDDRANINVGCVAHNTIVHAGTDLMFGSRYGVHTMRRSIDNGLTIFSASLADKIRRDYRKAVNAQSNKEDITGVFDQDNARLHLFFPITPRPEGVRLSLDLTPANSEDEPTWATASNTFARCGAFLAGRLIFGSPSGVFEVLDDDDDTIPQPEMVIETPMLWLGSMVLDKAIRSLILQASGDAELLIEVYDDLGRQLKSIRTVATSGSSSRSFPVVPLDRQYEIPLRVRARGIQLRISASGSGLFRINGFALTTEK